MPFIIAKTVTYVSSLTVTYVTTLYIPAARQLTDLSVRLNGTMLGIVRIRPLWLLTVGLYRAGGYDPPLQFRCGAVGIRPTRFIILGLYRAGGW